jgi:hypothetical protein
MPSRRFTSALIIISAFALTALCQIAASKGDGVMRRVEGITPHKQNFVVLDDHIWMHARRDLADLRLYAGDSEVPYALILERGSISAQRTSTTLLDIGRARKGTQTETQFVVEVQGLAQCDQIQLKLVDIWDFVSPARVEGLDSEMQEKGDDLGGSALFDFTHEFLGADSTVKFRATKHRFLRVYLEKIAPEKIKGAVVINSQIHNSAFTPDSGDLPISQDGSSTVLTWDDSKNNPVARIILQIDPSEINFARGIQILTPTGATITNTSIRRVHIVRNGILVQTETVAIDLPDEVWVPFRILIENGKDAPLKVTSAKAYSYERRVYFDPISSTALNLYYGYQMLRAPSYGYSEDFHADDNAAVASLSNEMSSPEYREQPGPRGQLPIQQNH